jgi:hypothetical protein
VCAPNQAHKSQDDLVQKLAKRVMAEPALKDVPWSDLVLVADIDDDGSGTHGYAYAPNGEINPFSASLSTLEGFEQLRDATRAPGKGPWKACLMRINRATSSSSIEYEHDHPEKWGFTANFEDMEALGKKLRPKRP